MKEDNTTITFRLPVSVKEKLEKKAESEDRTLSNYILRTLKESIKDKEASN